MTPTGTGSISDILNNSNPVPGAVTYSIVPYGPTPSVCVGSAVTLTVTVEPVTTTPTITTAGTLLTSSATTGNQWYLNGVAITGATGQTYTVTSNGTYTVLSTTNGCASAVSAPVVFTTVAVGSLSHNDNISIYPNPSSGIVTIETGNLTVKEIKVYDVLGQIVIRAEVKNNKTEVNLMQQANGVYFIQLSSAEGTYNYKVMKQ